MRAMRLTGLRRMEMSEVPTPKVAGATDVLLRQAMVGVCGSDVHYYLRGNIGSQVVRYPFTVGHECAAVVEQVGTAVKRVRPGDRVAVDPAISCGQCDQCRCGRPHTCRKLRFLGCPGQAEGCLSEFFVMPEACCHPLGPGVSLEQAALIEPLSIGLYAVRLSVPMNGARIGILGCGPIGLSVLACARRLGAGRVYATDKIEARAEAARRAGADWAGNPEHEDVVRAIAEREPLLLDAVFECCGEQEALDQAVELLKPGGKLMLVGIPTVERVSFVIDRLRRMELCIQNVRRQCECAAPTLAMVEQGALDAGFMITHRFPFERTQEAFELVAEYRDGVLKAVIQFA